MSETATTTDTATNDEEAKRMQGIRARLDLDGLIRQYMRAQAELEEAQRDVQAALGRLNDLRKPIEEAWFKAGCPVGSFKVSISYQDYVVALEDNDGLKPITVTKLESL